MCAPLFCPQWLEEVLRVTGVVSPLALPSTNAVNRVAVWRGRGWVYLMFKKVLEKQKPQYTVEVLMAHYRISSLLA